MAKIYFADETETIEIFSYRLSNIAKAIGEDIVEEITTEIDCYDLEEDEKELVKSHPDARFYMAKDDVFGAWQQPLYLFCIDD